MKKLMLIFPILILFIAAAGCSENSNEPSGNGSIKMYLVDAPAMFDAVNIVVTRVEVHMAGSADNEGWVVVNNEARTFDLLELRNGANAILGNAELSAGKYTQVRLILGEGCNVIVGGVAFNLDIASGSTTGIKLNHPFEIEANATYELTLDFDAGKSIHLTGSGKYKMNAVIRIIANKNSGSVAGRILPIEANPMVWTVTGSDTISTYIDDSGFFKLIPLPEDIYDIHIESNNVVYKDSTITNVNVSANAETVLETIMLSPAD